MIRLIQSVAYLFVLPLLVVLPLAAHAADDLTILVAPRDSAAANADKQADGKEVLAERKLFKAFDQASAHLTTCKTCTVTIKVAGGNQVGKGQVGQWIFPETITPDATLRILGGWDDKFAKRDPLGNPTILVTGETRSGSVVQFEGKKHALKELLFSGFAIDVGPANRYDKETNSLLKASSSSWPLLAFGYIAVDKLIVADNVFMNAANAVSGPVVRTATASSEVIIRNNLFLNNVFCWQVSAASGKYLPKRYLIEGNSFILNFPYNPDAWTSNPGTLQIGNKYTAEVVEIKDNLFAYNVGGAIFPQWDDKIGPKLLIQDNLFWENGALFGKGSGKGAVVGKFNKSAVYGSYTPEEIEDDFSWTTKGNVVLDPELAVPVLDMKAVSYGGQKDTKKDEKKDEAAEEDGGFFGTPKSDIDMDTDVEVGDYAVDGKIKNFAPRMPFNVETFPVTKADNAKKYGASPTRVVTP